VQSSVLKGVPLFENVSKKHPEKVNPELPVKQLTVLLAIILSLIVIFSPFSPCGNK
jgi:hypothetical protein